MTIPSFINEKFVTNTMRWGIGTLFGGGAMFLLYIVLTGGFRDLSQDIQEVHADHQQINREFQDMKDAMIRESRKQTILQQKSCIRLSESKREADDCLIFEP